MSKIGKMMLILCDNDMTINLSEVRFYFPKEYGLRYIAACLGLNVREDFF